MVRAVYIFMKYLFLSEKSISILPLSSKILFMCLFMLKNRLKLTFIFGPSLLVEKIWTVLVVHMP